MKLSEILDNFNKIFAKLGSDYKKPDATTVISRENYQGIVFPLPASDLLFVGKAATATLAKMGIQTIGDLARSDRELLRARLGKMGGMIWEYANGLDADPVKSASQDRDMKSVGNGMTFKRNLVGLEDIKTGVLALSSEVAYRMRKYGVKCRVVQVSIKDPSLRTISRQKTLEHPTHLAKEISDTVMELIQNAWNVKAPIRALTVTGANLMDEGGAGEQISLLDTEYDARSEKLERLERALDGIREQHGISAVRLGSLLHTDIGI